jgi:hypothetical protein
MKNTAITVQGTLSKFANKLQPAPLEDIVKAAERELGIGVNRTWATQALESRGFVVEDVADQRVVRKPGVCINPPQT